MIRIVNQQNCLNSCKDFVFGNVINIHLYAKISLLIFIRASEMFLPLLTVFIISFLHMVFIAIFQIDEKKNKFHSNLHPLLRVFTYTQIASRNTS